jgi:Lon protease-like protein
VIVGETRFAIEALPDTDRPYLIGLISPFEDVPTADRASTEANAGDVRVRLVAYRKAVAQLTEEMAATTLPEDPVALSFAAAAVIGVDTATKVRLLTLRSAEQRLETLVRLLERGTEVALEQVQVQTRAKRNGKRPAVHSRDAGS